MISGFLIVNLGLIAFGGVHAECSRKRVDVKREIICYTSMINIEKLADSICKCTTLIYNDRENLHTLNYSNIIRVQTLSKAINPSIEFVIGVSNERQVSENLSIESSKEIFMKISFLLKMADGVELKMQGHEKSHLIKLVRQLRNGRADSTLQKRKKILISLPSNLEILSEEFDIMNLNKYIDLFILPTHYMTDGGQIYKTFHPSRLMGLYDNLNTDTLVDFVNSLGASKEKIVISLMTNAYKFHLNKKYDNGPSASSLDKEPTPINREELCRLITSNGEWTIERDEDSTAPYAFNKSIWIAFEDNTSAIIKGKYVILRNLAGIALRNIEDDHPTNCSGTITDYIHDSFSHNSRMSREAIFDSLINDTNHLNGKQSSHLKSTKYSNFKISRIVDSNGEIHAVRENMLIEFTCISQGYFVHPLSCNRFYRCVKFNQALDDYSVFEFDCPSGLAFDERTEVCVWPGSLPQGYPCRGSSEIAPTPVNRFHCFNEGYYADPQNCRWFFACVETGEGELTAYEFRCPYGLVFDETSVACQWPRLVSACSKVNGVKYGSSTESSEKLNRRLTTKEEIDEARIIYLKQKPDIVTFPQEYEKFPEQTNFHKNQLNSNDPLSVTNVRQREPSVNGNDHFNDGINYSFTTTRRTPTTYLNNDRVNRPTHSPIEIDTTDISSNNLAKEEDDQRIDTMINVDKGAKTNVNHSNNVIANPKTSHKVQNITTVTPSGIVGMRADGLFNDGLISDVNYSIQIMNNHTSTILRNYSNLIPMFSKESNGSTEKTEIYISMASNSSSGIGITPASSYQPPQNYKFDEKNSKLNFDSNREVPLFDQHLHRTTERVTSSSSESIEMTNVNQALDSNVNSKNPAIADIIKSSTSGYSTVEFGEYEETTSGSMKPEKTEERLENTKLLALNNSYMDRIIHSAHEYDKIGFDRMTSNFPSQIDVTPVFLFNSTDGYYENEEDERIQHTVREFNASEHKKENKNLQNYSGGSTQKVTLVSTQFTPAIWPTEIFDINKNIRTSPMRYHIQSTTSVSSPAIFRMLNSDQGLISKNSVTEIVIDNETIQPHHVISPTLINSYERNPFLKDKAVSNHRLPNGKTESLAVINRDTLLDGDRDSNNLNKIVKSTYMRNPFLNKEQAMKEEGPHHKENEEDDGKFPDELTTVSTRNRNHDSTSIESRVDRGSIIVKYSDLHPILLRKLKAECKCSADPFGGFRYSKQPLFIDSSIGAIDLRNYDETNVYVDLGLPKKTVEKTAKFFNNVNSELTTANLLDPSNNIIGRVHSARDNAARDARSFPNFRQIHHSKDMVDNVDSSLFDKIECARPGLFRDTKFCNKFYTCHWDKWQNKFIPRIFNCPVHLAINDETGGCNWPSNGPACQNNQLLL